MKNIYKSLAQFQQEVPIILKETTGYGYKYADLPAIFATINPLLKKHGLGFYQAVSGKQIKTVVFHIESGEEISSDTDIPQGVSLKGMNDFQVLGSAITYIRRYALSSILGLITDKDTDAHGEQEVSTPKVSPFEQALKKIKAEKDKGEAKKWVEKIEKSTLYSDDEKFALISEINEK